MPEYLAALRDANQRLELDPHGWGDLLRTYGHINAVQRRGLMPQWFLVWYGVDGDARQVVIHDLLAAPGSPLTDVSNGT